MKKVLIYGDSNTWGDNFITGVRIPDDKQWPNILQKNSKDLKIIQEGLPGRIAGAYEVEKKHKNGKDCFISTYRTNAPVDIVIIALGSNDLQVKYNKSSEEIIDSLCWYQKIIEEQYSDIDDQKKYFVNKKMPRIIYIMPPNFDYLNGAAGIFDEESENKRQEIINYFRKNYKENIIVLENVDLFEDGLHLSYSGHEQMAKVVGDMLHEG